MDVEEEAFSLTFFLIVTEFGRAGLEFEVPRETRHRNGNSFRFLPELTLR